MAASSQGQTVIAGYAGTPGSYRYHLATRVAEIDRQSWEGVCQTASDPFMELRYLLANENAFAGEAQFWYATLLDEQDQAVGCACFTRYHVDVAMLGPPISQWFATQVRHVWRSFLKVPVLLGGSPVSTCRSQLMLTDGIDMDRAVATMDQIVNEIVRQAPVEYITFKEFSPAFGDRMSGLKKHGYQRAHSIVTYDLPGEFSSFDAYYNSRSKRTRAKIRKHFQKLDAAGVTYVQCRGGEGAVERFTDEVHRLYLNVLAKAEKKLERLPAEYFRELARQYPEESRFTFFYKGERPVGFCCGLDSPGGHTLLFCGLDYTLNNEADLYFNIIFRGLSFGLIPGVKSVSIGGAADQFKQQMGCKATPLWIYLKGAGILRAAIVNWFSWMIFHNPPANLPLLDGEPEETREIPAERAA